MKIYVGKFYIVYLRDILKPRILHYYFSSRAMAKKAIVDSLPYKDRKWYKVMSGKYLRKYEPELCKSIKLIPTKYKYPSNSTQADRKKHRTLMRRRLRRMGMLVHSKPYSTVHKPPKRIKAVKNKQKVAQSPGTISRVVEVDRRGSHKLFLILSFKRAKRVGDLYVANSVCFNFRKKTVEEKSLRIKNTDVLTPYTLIELRNRVRVTPGMPSGYLEQYMGN